MTPMAVGLPGDEIGTVIVTLPNPVVMGLFRAQNLDNMVLSQMMQTAYLKTYRRLTNTTSQSSKILDGIVPVTRFIAKIGFKEGFKSIHFAQGLIGFHHELFTQASPSEKTRYIGIAARTYSGWYVSIASLQGDGSLEFEVFKSNKPASSAWMAIYNYNGVGVRMSGRLAEVIYLYVS